MGIWRFVFIGLLVVMIGLLFINRTQESTLQTIDAQTLSTMIASEEDIVMIDLREPELYEEGRIPNSINIPFAQFKDRYNILPKDKKIVLICHTGRMGEKSGIFLLTKHFQSVYNLAGGMSKWSGEKESVR